MQPIQRQDFERLVIYMKNTYGINLDQHLPLVEARLEPLMRVRNFSGLGDYLDYVIKDKSAEESRLLVSTLTTNFTYFMRESQHYSYLQSIVLPQLRDTLKPKDIRTWSAGCSSGEEAYTMAMVFDDFFGAAKKEWDTTILATDISPSVLQMAKTGIYAADRLEKLSPAWKARYFTRIEPNRYRVNESLKREVVVQSFNLIDKFPFRKKFHIIFCRNVMFYFDTATRVALTSRFYDHLEPGGHLIVGMSETVDTNASKFQFVEPAIYRK